MKKYNWHTAQEDQKDLSLESKIEYILRFWDLKEIVKTVKKYFEITKKVFNERTKKDIMISEKSKYFLEHLIHLKEKDVNYSR